jgi:hypothetical protein
VLSKHIQTELYQLRVAAFFPRHEQGCQIFIGTKYQNGGKIYQIAIHYTKWSQNIPNGRKIDQMAVK